jgi:hypothetical protein
MRFFASCKKNSHQGKKYRARAKKCGHFSNSPRISQKKSGLVPKFWGGVPKKWRFFQKTAPDPKKCAEPRGKLRPLAPNSGGPAPNSGGPPPNSEPRPPKSGRNPKKCPEPPENANPTNPGIPGNPRNSQECRKKPGAPNLPGGPTSVFSTIRPALLAGKSEKTRTFFFAPLNQPLIRRGEGTFLGSGALFSGFLGIPGILGFLGIPGIPGPGRRIWPGGPRSLAGGPGVCGVGVGFGIPGIPGNPGNRRIPSFSGAGPEFLGWARKFWGRAYILGSGYLIYAGGVSKSFGAGTNFCADKSSTCLGMY